MSRDSATVSNNMRKIHSKDTSMINPLYLLSYLRKLYILLSFCYHKRLSGHSPGNRFSTLFVILFHSFIYFQATEKPVEPKFYGYLTFGHNVILR